MTCSTVSFSLWQQPLYFNFVRNRSKRKFYEKKKIINRFYVISKALEFQLKYNKTQKRVHNYHNLFLY